MLPSYRVLSSGSQSASSAFKFPTRNFSTSGSTPENVSAAFELPPRIKFKRLDKTARHIMQIIDKEVVEEVKSSREIPEIKPGYIIQLKVVVPENKRRVSIIKGIVIAMYNAGLNTTFRIRRLVGGVGIENLFPLYSPNIKEITVLDKKRVRRAKLYYLRDRMNPLRKN
ncbi:50S ribosomal protein L19, chloroplastic-like isoform X2 [Salvia miltiorrhiza]|nr:50S ribosomal protein L19, chloroplastic-like isoform X2 [Salvia miltiorrhiza]